jgi:hypothetical protein
MFSCAFVGSRYYKAGLQLRSGVIVFNGVAEVFDSPIAAWKEDDYEQSWLEAIEFITSPSPRNAAIITGYNGFDAAFLHWWPLYPVGDWVFIREQYLMLENVRMRINEENMFSFTPERFREDSVSEWREARDAISLFGHCLMIARTN